MKKIIAILLVALALTACVSTNSSVNTASKGSSKTNKLSFENEEGSLLISNTTSCDVVVFAGRVEKDIVLGGIKSGEKRSFNLAKLPEIPKKGALLLRIAPYIAYEKGMRITEGDVVYTRLLVYDLTDKKKNILLDIPKNIDMEQKHYVVLTNLSTYVLEVREGSPTGEVIATLSPMQFNKPIFLLPKRDYGAYDLFPLFLYRDIETGEVVSTVPSRGDRMRIIPKPITRGAEMLQFDAPSKEEMPIANARIEFYMED